MANIKEYLGNKVFYKRLVAIAVPISMQGLITIGVNMMDTIMLGSMGEIAISASSLANQFINIFHIFCMGMGMGANVMTARFWGAKDIPSLKKVCTIMFRMCIFISMLFTLATIVAPDMIMGIYTSETDVIAEGVKYFWWSIPTYFFMGMSLVTTIVLRSVGKVKVPLYTSIGAFFVNIFFNWMFIFGKLGAPRMEVAGAALGTLISRVFEFAIICGYFFLKDKDVGYRVKDLFMKCKDMVGDYMRISLPVFISDAMLALGENMVTMIIGRLGASFVSANAITMVTVRLSTVFSQGLSNASAIMTGHTLGMGEVEQAKKQGWTFLGLGALIGLFAGGFIMLTSDLIISFYNINAETQAIAQELMLAVGFIVIFQVMNGILTKGVLRGGGDTKFLMVADILFLWIASVPLGYFAGLVWHWPAFGIYTMLKIDQIIKAVWCIFRLKSNKWIKKV